MPLNKSTGIVGDRTAGKKADLLHCKIVVGRKPGGSTPRLRLLGMRKGRLQHDGKGRPFPIATAQRVAAKLETAAERGQFEKRGVAGGARLSGLSRIQRQRQCWMGRKGFANNRKQRENAEHLGRRQPGATGHCGPDQPATPKLHCKTPPIRAAASVARWF
jgi:hypothetical protein